MGTTEQSQATLAVPDSVIKEIAQGFVLAGMDADGQRRMVTAVVEATLQSKVTEFGGRSDKTTLQRVIEEEIVKTVRVVAQAWIANHADWIEQQVHGALTATLPTTVNEALVALLQGVGSKLTRGY